MKIDIMALTPACFMGVLIVKLAENLKNNVLAQKNVKNHGLFGEAAMSKASAGLSNRRFLSKMSKIMDFLEKQR